MTAPFGISLHFYGFCVDHKWALAHIQMWFSLMEVIMFLQFWCERKVCEYPKLLESVCGSKIVNLSWKHCSFWSQSGKVLQYVKGKCHSVCLYLWPLAFSPTKTIFWVCVKLFSLKMFNLQGRWHDSFFLHFCTYNIIFVETVLDLWLFNCR